MNGLVSSKSVKKAPKRFDHFVKITDNFRMSVMQNETLDWELIEEKAQIAIERCNHTCKSHAMPVSKRLASANNCIASDAFKNLLQMPVVPSSSLFGAMSESDMLTMALRYNLHKHVRKYALPVRIQHKQFSQRGLWLEYPLRCRGY
jgi:CRISPR/Cas system CSM-associated protein Csm3 (group 7 of RAMP superfamily)